MNTTSCPLNDFQGFNVDDGLSTFFSKMQDLSDEVSSKDMQPLPAVQEYSKVRLLPLDISINTNALGNASCLIPGRERSLSDLDSVDTSTKVSSPYPSTAESSPLSECCDFPDLPYLSFDTQNQNQGMMPGTTVTSALELSDDFFKSDPADKSWSLPPIESQHHDLGMDAFDREADIALSLAETVVEVGAKVIDVPRAVKAQVAIPALTPVFSSSAYGSSNTSLPPSAPEHTPAMNAVSLKQLRAIPAVTTRATFTVPAVVLVQMQTSIPQQSPKTAAPQQTNGLLPRSADKDNKWPCPIEFCNKRYHHKGSLRRHLKTHDEQKKHKCAVCDKEFY